MGKVLTWVAIALVVWAIWRLVTISRRRSARARAASGGEGAGTGPGRDRAGEPARGATPELMMQCAVCGVHLPGSEARFGGGRVYCSDAHRDQAAGAARDRAPDERG